MQDELDEKTIVRALGRLSELLGDRGITGEVCLLGGTVMVLAFKTRARTKDVGAIFHPVQVIRELAHVVQREMDLPENWINDGAKAFISPRHDVVPGDLPQFPHLRVAAPTTEYMLAMKCMASRIPARPDEHGDAADIAFLIRRLGLTTPDVHAGRKLRRPWFAHPGRALRATLLLESPAPFRERNLFVSENALSRA